MAGKINKITVGLVKTELTNFAEIAKPGADAIEIEGIGTFYKEASHPRPPSWIADFFGTTLGPGLGLLSSSAKGVLLVRVVDGEEDRIFAVIFGLGRHLLNDDVLEERFGLKVVLNSVDPDSLRSIDKTALGSIPKQSREQISREGGAANFGIDVEQDSANYLRLEIFYDGSSPRLFAGTVLNNVFVQQINTSVPGLVQPMWLKIARTGNSWTLSYSTNGTTFTPGGTFSAPLVVSKIGPYAGNS